MKQFITLTLAFFVTACMPLQAQFMNAYPIGENPGVSFMTPMVNNETILFEALPIVRMSFYNNILTRLARTDPQSNRNYNHAHAEYVSFRPQLRMYTDNSLPVKMPSYRILFGTQQIWRLPNDNLLAFSVESGHYSNGQYGCAYAEGIEDGSPACDSVYETITDNTDLSDKLNRRSGEFSTNMTEVIVNYRINHLDDDCTPDRFISINAGTTYYHDRMLFVLPFGGYSDHDIDIYGHWRWLMGLEGVWIFKERHNWFIREGARLSLAHNIEKINGAHPSVDPWRFETTLSLFFPNVQNMGVYIKHIAGHDNYNVRFVDSGQQLVVGIAWNIFPAFKIKNICDAGADQQ